MDEMLCDMGFDPKIIQTAISNIGSESSQNMDNILAEIERIQDLPEKDQKVSSESPKEEEESKKDPKQAALAQHEANLKKAQSEAIERKRKHDDIEKRAAEARDARVEREKQEKIEMEKNRRKQGSKMQEDKSTFEEQEMRKRQALMKMERDADKEAKNKIKRELALDRENRKLARDKMDAERKAAQEGKKSSTKIETSPKTTKSAPKSDSPTTRIQIRLPNNQRLQNTFNSNECLSAVRLFIQLNASADLKLGDDASTEILISQAYPRKTFTEDQFEAPLSVLGLVPSASLMVEVKRAQVEGSVQGSVSQDEMIDQIFQRNNLR